MPFSKGELLDIANARAAELGISSISESVFESWIDNRFAEGAHPHGHKRGVNPTWLYPDGAREAVVRIVELQAKGAKRKPQKLVCLWVLGTDFPSEEIIAALKLELRRITKRQERGPRWWQHHYDDIHNLSDAERTKRIEQLPPVDPDLAATNLALSSEVMFEVALRCHWGAEEGGDIPKIISREVAQKLGLPPGSLSDEFFAMLDFNGAFGPPDESANDGYEILDRISSDDLEAARAKFWVCLLGLLAGDLFFSAFGTSPDDKRGLAYRKALDALMAPEWIVVNVAVLAISAFHTRTAKHRLEEDRNGAK
jgi:hypothetical protein